MGLLDKRIRTTHLLRYDLSSLDSEAENREDIVIGTLEFAQMEQLKSVNPDIDLSLEIRKFQTGLKCYVASLNDRLVHYSWVQDSGLHELARTGRRRNVSDGNLWIHACFTAEWARGRRIYQSVLRRILHDYKVRGFHTAWIYVQDENAASRRGILRAGFSMESRLRAFAFRNDMIPIP